MVLSQSRKALGVKNHRRDHLYRRHRTQVQRVPPLCPHYIFIMAGFTGKSTCQAVQRGRPRHRQSQKAIFSVSTVAGRLRIFSQRNERANLQLPGLPLPRAHTLHIISPLHSDVHLPANPVFTISSRPPFPLSPLTTNQPTARPISSDKFHSNVSISKTSYRNSGCYFISSRCFGCHVSWHAHTHARAH